MNSKSKRKASQHKSAVKSIPVEKVRVAIVNSGGTHLYDAESHLDSGTRMLKSVIERLQAAHDYTPNPGLVRDLNALRGALREFNRGASQLDKAAEARSVLFDLLMA